MPDDFSSGDGIPTQLKQIRQNECVPTFLQQNVW